MSKEGENSLIFDFHHGHHKKNSAILLFEIDAQIELKGKEDNFSLKIQQDESEHGLDRSSDFCCFMMNIETRQIVSSGDAGKFGNIIDFHPMATETEKVMQPGQYAMHIIPFWKKDTQNQYQVKMTISTKEKTAFKGSMWAIDPNDEKLLPETKKHILDKYYHSLGCFVRESNMD